MKNIVKNMEEMTESARKAMLKTNTMSKVGKDSGMKSERMGQVGKLAGVKSEKMAGIVEMGEKKMTAQGKSAVAKIIKGCNDVCGYKGGGIEPITISGKKKLNFKI